MKVLVVDDAPDIRRVLTLLFKMDGHEVIEAEHGMRALEVLAREDVDAMITDFRMPKMDGLELLRAIKERGLDLHPIMLTAYPSEALEKEARALGADFLTKPFDVNVLRATLAHARHI